MYTCIFIAYITWLEEKEKKSNVVVVVFIERVRASDDSQFVSGVGGRWEVFKTALARCGRRWQRARIIHTKENTNGFCSHQRKRLIPFSASIYIYIRIYWRRSACGVTKNIVAARRERRVRRLCVHDDDNGYIRRRRPRRSWCCFSDLSKTAAGWCAPNSCERTGWGEDGEKTRLQTEEDHGQEEKKRSEKKHK